jgi:tRNA(Ile)-lysidine synthase
MDIVSEQLIKFLNKSQAYLVAVSGGVDSMVLLHALLINDYTIQVAHFNYQLRGADSNADEQLVIDFCTKWQIPLHIKSFNTKAYIAEKKVGLQEGARNLRYQYFSEICEHQNLCGVLTAHHADDQIETVLMNIGRGTGLNGLTGIKVKNKINNLMIIRCLLYINKQEIEQYAAEFQVPFRVDASNLSSDYRRNALRNDVIPAWQSSEDRFRKNMLQNIEQWGTVQGIYNSLVKQTLKKSISHRGSELYLHLHSFKKLDPLVQWIFEAVNSYGFSFGQCHEIVKIMDADNGKFIASETHRAIKQNDFIIVSAKQTLESGHILIQQNETNIQTKDFTLAISQLKNDGLIDGRSEVALIDANKIQFPLVLRPWKLGDYFYPLGMQKKKKVARFLIDAKMPLLQKEKTWVVESNGKIIWIVGQRIDDRVKVSGNTKVILKMVME